MRTKKTALDTQIEASHRFNPKALCGHLMTENGVVCVNKSTLLQTDDDERLFIVELSTFYRSGYKDIDDLTAYFEVIDGHIYGGAYNTKTSAKISRRCVVAPFFDDKDRYRYVYMQDTYDKIYKTIVSTAQNANSGF